MAVSENRFAPELNEKEDIELLGNATSGRIKKATKYGVKIFQGKNLKTFFLTIQASELVKAKQCKLRHLTQLQIQYIATSGFFSK